MKENYIVPLMTVFAVSPVRALMTSGDTKASGGVPNFYVDSYEADWEE